MIGRKIGALCAKKTVALPGSCRLPTAAGQISLIPEQAQDGDTTERQRRLPSISNTPVGIECRVTRQDSVGWAGMARQLRAGNSSNSRHPAHAGHTGLSAEQCERSPAAKHWWLSGLAPNFSAAPPCTDTLACYGTLWRRLGRNKPFVTNIGLLLREMQTSTFIFLS